MKNLVVTLISGVGLGVGASYFFDPERGRRRRARARDKMLSAAHVTGGAIDTTSRDVANRTQGLLAGIRSRLTRDDVIEPVLVERVRARIGGVVSHPSSIEVTAADGRITLRGPILAHEVDRLIRRVAVVRGVRSIDSQLQVHQEPSDVPGLQGAPARRRGLERFEFFQTQWSPTARLLAGIAGGSLGLVAARQAGLTGLALGAAGLTLLARAATNLELKRLLGVGGGRRAVVVQKTIDVAAPLEDVFDFWSRYENFPRFMAHVREVRRGAGDRSHWTVAGPGGVPIRWDTEVTRFEPNRLIAWKTVEGAPVAHSGMVRFDPNPDGTTRVDIKMSYNPPGGAMGHAVAAFLGSDPKRAMDDDLVRFKSLLEEGRTRVRGEPVKLNELG